MAAILKAKGRALRQMIALEAESFHRAKIAPKKVTLSHKRVLRRFFWVGMVEVSKMVKSCLRIS